MGWIKRLKPTDTGTLDITSLATGMTAGTWTIRRSGSWIYTNLYRVAVTPTSGDLWQVSNMLPVGFRPPNSSVYTHFPSVVRASNESPGPLRVDRYGGVTLYAVNDGKQINVTAVWVTDDAWPTSLPGVML